MLKIKNKNKSAELTTQQIVLLVILIASFVIILLLLFRLNLKEQTQAEICHNSVILKGKSTFGSGNLDCKTSYVCISGGEKCIEINPTKTITIDTRKSTEEIKNQTLKAIADEMAECWWMFGEGKVNYAGTGDKALGKTICAVCSIVKFDASIENSIKEISYKDFVERGLTQKYKNGKTYLQYIYGANSSEDLYKKEGFNVIKNDVETGKSISLKDRNMIRTGIVSGALFGKTGFSPNKIIYPYFFDVNNIRDPQCGEFITKA